MTFQQDNARLHVAHLIRPFLNNNNINVLQWPAMSPDLNPIEYLWDPLDRDVRHQQPRTIPQLENALVNAWNGLKPYGRETTMSVYAMRGGDAQRL